MFRLLLTFMVFFSLLGAVQGPFQHEISMTEQNELKGVLNACNQSDLKGPSCVIFSSGLSAFNHEGDMNNSITFMQEQYDTYIKNINKEVVLASALTLRKTLDNDTESAEHSMEICVSGLAAYGMIYENERGIDRNLVDYYSWATRVCVDGDENFTLGDPPYIEQSSELSTK